MSRLGVLVDKATAGLQRLGVDKGTKVGLCLPNMPYSIILYFAILKAGGTVVNFSPLYVERELENQIRNSGTTIMVVPDLKIIHSRVAAIADAAQLSKIIVCPMRAVLPWLKGIGFELFKRKDIAVFDRMDGRHLTFADLTRDVVRPRPVDITPDVDVAVLQYTGGTTGVPKGAQLTHANITANADQVIQHVCTIREGEDKVLGVLPLFHVFAMTNVMNVPIAKGCEIILVPRFNLADLVAVIEKERPTVFPGVADHFYRAQQLSRHHGADTVVAPPGCLRRRAAAGGCAGAVRGIERLQADRGIRPQRDFAGADREPAKRNHQGRLGSASRFRAPPSKSAISWTPAALSASGKRARSARAGRRS